MRKNVIQTTTKKLYVWLIVAHIKWDVQNKDKSISKPWIVVNSENLLAWSLLYVHLFSQSKRAPKWNCIKEDNKISLPATNEFNQCWWANGQINLSIWRIILFVVWAVCACLCIQWELKNSPHIIFHEKNVFTVSQSRRFEEISKGFR